MTNWYGYPYIALTGGGDGALDSLDGSLVKNGDFAVVVVEATKSAYVYALDADSGATEDGVNVIAPDSNAGDKRWVLTNSPSNRTDVKFFGAKGDGITDDTAAIHAADAYCASVGAELVFNEGTYLVTALVLTSKSIRGAGRGQCIIHGSTNSDHVVTLSSSWTTFSGFKISSSVAAASRTGSGLKVTGGPGCIVRDLYVVGHYYGVWNTGQGNHFENIITDGNLYHGFFIDGSVASQNEMRLLFCQSNSNLQNGFMFTGPGVGISVVFCTAASNTKNGMEFTAATNDVWIINPEISTNGYGGIIIGTGNSVYQIVNPFIETCASGWGIYVQSPLVSIDGGYIQGGASATYGGLAINHTDVSVAGMVISSNDGSGIRLGTSSARVTLSSIVVNDTASTGETHDYGLTVDGGAAAVTMSGIDVASISAPLNGTIPAGSVIRGCPGIPDWTTTVSGMFAKTRIPITLANGLNSNIATADASFIDITGPTTTYSIGGFTSPSDGQELTIWSNTAAALTIVNEDVSSTAANRITTSTGGNVTGAFLATFIYNATTSRWLLRSHQP